MGVCLVAVDGKLGAISPTLISGRATREKREAFGLAVHTSVGENCCMYEADLRKLRARREEHSGRAPQVASLAPPLLLISALQQSEELALTLW